VMWYQVDERDEDVATCFHYLSLTSAQLDLPEPESLPRYSPEYARGLTAFARSFFGALFAALPERAVLVFDNYQEVPEDAALHQVMQMAVEELPIDCQMIIISRHLPPPAYMRLQANQRLGILGQAQLGFSEDEAFALLKLRGHDLTDGAELKSWLAINRGWAAGLVLYSEWARLGQTELGRIDSLGSEAVFDYFAGEIQARVATQDARFLARSALLPVMKPTLAAELTGIADAGEILDRLHRRNSFTTRYDGPSVAYEFHPLFRQYLLKELERTHDQAALAELRHAAADLLARDGQIEAAMDLLVKARRWRRMGALLCQHSIELINHGRHRLVENWLTQFPDEAFDSEPWLAYWRGACRLFESAAESQAWMERAYYGFKATRQVDGICRAWCGVCRAIRFTWGDYSLFDPWIEELEALLDENPQLPSPAVECEVLLNAVAALHWRDPIHPRMQEWAARAPVLADASGDLCLQVAAHGWAAFFVFFYDEVPEASHRVRHLESLLKHPVGDPFINIFGHFVVGLYAYAIGCSEQAAAIFYNQMEHAHALGLLTWDVTLYVWYGFARLAQGDVKGAEEASDRLVNHPAIQGAFGAHFYHEFCTALALEQGRTEQAMNHAQAALAAAGRAGSPYMKAWALGTVAQVEVTAGGGCAAEYLDAALKASRRLGARWGEAQMRMSHALYVCQHESREQATFALQEAMDLIRAQTLLHFGYAPKLARLFAVRALERGVGADYAHKILAAHPNAQDTVPPAHLEAWPWVLKVYTLGPFRLLRHGVPVTFGRKPPRRPLEVLKALIAMGGREVPEARILESLWPDDEADSARNSFSTALNRLRKIAGHDLIRLEGGKLSLDASRCWVDVWAFENLLARADEGTLRQAVGLYQDKFLAEDAEAPWSMRMRDRLQGRYAEAVARLAETYQKAGNHEGAVALFKQGLITDELREDFYQGLMRSYVALGKPEEARQAFEFCKRRLSIRLNRKPSATTVGLFESIETPK
jgi:LuxR family maltose regulon positive regulatory protein